MKTRHQSVQWLSPEGLHRLAYREWGAADNPHVLICVHGLTRTSADFETLANSLSQTLRIIAPDMPGRGQSDWLPSGSMYVIPYYIQAMIALVARANASTLDWLGTSMGGLIGMGYAGLTGCPIRRLILNDVAPTLNLNALKRIGEYVGKPVTFNSLAEGRTYVRKIIAPFGPHTQAQFDQLTDSVLIQKNNHYTLHYDPTIGDSFRNLTEATVHAHEDALWQAYDHITAKTLLIHGELSDLVTPATALEMTQRGPKAMLKVITGIGHAPTLMTTEQIQIIQDFLV